MDYDKLCNEIMKLDPLIRFVAILNQNGDRVAESSHENISSLLNPEEVKLSQIMHHADGRLVETFRIGLVMPNILQLPMKR